MGDAPVSFSPPGFRIIGYGFGGLGLALGIAAAIMRSDWTVPERVVVGVVVWCSAAPLFRWAFVSVTLEPAGLRVRNFLQNCRIPYAEIASVSDGRSAMGTVVAVHTRSGRRRPIEALPLRGNRRRDRERADAFQRALEERMSAR